MEFMRGSGEPQEETKVIACTTRVKKLDTYIHAF
jgi:hypothetical protein